MFILIGSRNFTLYGCACVFFLSMVLCSIISLLSGGVGCWSRWLRNLLRRGDEDPTTNDSWWSGYQVEEVITMNEGLWCIGDQAKKKANRDSPRRFWVARATKFCPGKMQTEAHNRRAGFFRPSESGSPGRPKFAWVTQIRPGE